MRLAFMGSPDFGVPTLETLLAEGHEIAAVYSRPPRRASRGQRFVMTPVHRRAALAGVEVRTPASLKSKEEHDRFAALGLDAAVVAAYGLILPKAILEAPGHGCLNVHASLLPRWRGAAPVQRAILAGDEETGVSIMRMDEGLDTGPVYMRRATPLGARTAGELGKELAAMGAATMAEVLARLPDIEPVPQPGDGATYAPKIAKEETRLDFTAEAVAAERQVRAFNPMPGAWFEYGGGRIRVLEAEAAEASSGENRGSAAPGSVIDDRLTIACGDGVLQPLLVQRAGKRPMAAEELLRGFPIPKGARLS